jgi:hypothetical protein
MYRRYAGWQTHVRVITVARVATFLTHVFVIYMLD